MILGIHKQILKKKPISAGEMVNYTDRKNLPAFMVYVLVSQELGPIFQVNPRDMRSY